MPAAPIRVSVAEDHPLYRKGLSQAIHERAELSLVAEAADGRTALAHIREHQPHVAVLDIKMPRLDGMQVLHAVQRDALSTRIILLTAVIDGELVHQALTAGAVGFLSKESSGTVICEAVAVVARGEVALGPEVQSVLAGELRLRAPVHEPRLSEREAQILGLLAEGLSSGEIAQQLAVSGTTVKSHLRHLYEKLEVSDRAAAVARAMRSGLLE